VCIKISSLPMYGMFVHEILQFMLRYTVMFKASAVPPSLIFQLLAKCNIKNVGQEQRLKTSVILE
jgi:hypothetical protein